MELIIPLCTEWQEIRRSSDGSFRYCGEKWNPSTGGYGLRCPPRHRPQFLQFRLGQIRTRLCSCQAVGRSGVGPRIERMLVLQQPHRAVIGETHPVGNGHQPTAFYNGDAAVTSLRPVWSGGVGSVARIPGTLVGLTSNIEGAAEA